MPRAFLWGLPFGGLACCLVSPLVLFLHLAPSLDILQRHAAPCTGSGHWSFTWPAFKVPLKYQVELGVMAHAFNPSTGEARELCKFETSLVYITNSRTSRAVERDPVSKQTNRKKKHKRKKWRWKLFHLVICVCVLFFLAFCLRLLGITLCLLSSRSYQKNMHKLSLPWTLS